MIIRFSQKSSRDVALKDLPRGALFVYKDEGGRDVLAMNSYMGDHVLFVQCVPTFRNETPVNDYKHPDRVFKNVRYIKRIISIDVEEAE